jgi:hypothetical protein
MIYSKLGISERESDILSVMVDYSKTVPSNEWNLCDFWFISNKIEAMLAKEYTGHGHGPTSKAPYKLEPKEDK